MSKRHIEKARKIQTLSAAIEVAKRHGCRWVYETSRVRLDFYDGRGIKAHWWPGLGIVDVFSDSVPAVRPSEAMGI